MALFYCKICKEFFCDFHFDPLKIVGKIYNSKATNLMNKKYFALKI